MKTLLERLHDELESVDLNDTAQEQLEVRANESVLGVLNDQQRRLMGLKMLAIRENTRLIREHQAIASEEPIDWNRANDWVIRSSINRARIHAIEGLWLMSIAETFPQAMLCEVLVVREGWKLVGMHHTEFSEADDRLAMVIAGELAHNDRRLKH